MARLQGRLATIEVNDGGGFVAIACTRDINCNLETSELTSTCRDDGAFEAYEYGRMSGTIESQVVYDPTNTSYVKLVTSMFNQTKLTYRFRFQTNAGDPQYSGVGLVTSLGKSAPNDDMSTVDFSIRLSGTLTVGVQ